MMPKRRRPADDLDGDVSEALMAVGVEWFGAGGPDLDPVPTGRHIRDHNPERVREEPPDAEGRRVDRHVGTDRWDN